MNELSLATKSASSFIPEQLIETPKETCNEKKIRHVIKEKSHSEVDTALARPKLLLSSQKPEVSKESSQPLLATHFPEPGKSTLVKQHALQIVVKGKMCEDSISKDETLRSEAATPVSVDRHNTEDEDFEYDTTDNTCHKKYGLIRYRSLRDHNGRYFLVVKIR